MATVRSAAEFDEISEVYDATREPLEAPVIDRMAATLRAWGVGRLLEVGVGTGRVALPLSGRGIELTGLDASRGMLAHARAKGLSGLVLGSAYRLPFPDSTFDASLFVHVLHVLDEPGPALAEASRVARLGVAALVRPPGPRPSEDRAGWSARRLVLDSLRREGVPIPERAQGGPPVRERELLARFPPDRQVVVSEEDVTEPLARQLVLFEQRASRWTLRVPPEKLARAVAEARSAVGEGTHTYHRVRALAWWERPPGADRLFEGPGLPPAPGGI